MIKATCDNCNTEHTIDSNEIEFETSSYDKHSTAMSSETHYNSQWEIECKCGNALSVELFYVEYPTGMLETDETTANGCSITGNCSPI